MKTPKRPFYKKPSNEVISEYTKTLITPSQVVTTDVSDFTNKRGDVITAQDLQKWKADGMDWGSTKALGDWYDTLPAKVDNNTRYGFGARTQRNNPNRQMTLQEWELVKKGLGVNDANNKSRLSVDDIKSQGRDINNPIEPYNSFINENIGQIDEFLKNYRSKPSMKELNPQMLSKIKGG